MRTILKKKEFLYKLFTFFLLFMLSLCTGCSLNTLGNVGNFVIETAGDVNIFTDAEKLQFGREFVAQHEKQVTFYTDPAVTNYINDLGQSLVRYSKRKNIPYTLGCVKFLAVGLRCVL